MSKNINEKQTEINNKMIQYTLNANYHPFNTDKDEMEWDNFKALVYKNIRSRLINIILRMYKWKLPDTLNERVIEEAFLTRGWVTIFQDKLGIFALPCVPNNMWNIYGEPTQVSAYGFNGWNEIIDIKYFNEYPQIPGMEFEKSRDGRYGVAARDNYDNKKYIEYIDEYAKILTDNRLAIMIATDTLKQPHITVVPNYALKKTAKKVIQGVRENKRQIIVVDQDIKNGNTSMKDIISDIDLSGNIDAPKKLMEVYNSNFNMFLETIGINTNPSPDKSEVVLTPELNSNNSLIDLEQDVRFLCRKKLCEDAKKILGIDISVEKNIDETNMLINQMKYNEKGEDNGKESESSKKSTE